jgi:hypothetical protein
MLLFHFPVQATCCQPIALELRSECAEPFKFGFSLPRPCTFKHEEDNMVYEVLTVITTNDISTNKT